MTKDPSEYTCDLMVVGGGLAGLSLSILAAKAGFKVCLFERQSYPKHKVCGEYISNESREFLKHLGIPINDLHLPDISEFVLTTAHGARGSCKLSPGGFGISRYTLDHLLAEKAAEEGVQMLTNTHVSAIDGDINSGFSIHLEGRQFSAPLVLAAWGRGGGTVDKKPNQNTEAWIGVKYHVDRGPSEHQIEIHAFEGGYAGISKVEGDSWCLCYLVQAKLVKKYGGDLKQFEQAVLAKNKALANRLNATVKVGPVTTSLFHFGAKEVGGMPRLGDAAGFIPPLTGNGMSLALRSANDMFVPVQDFLLGKITADHFLEKQTDRQRYLNWRINRGVFLQYMLLIRPMWLNKLFMQLFTIHPVLLKKMTSLAVGKTIR